MYIEGQILSLRVAKNIFFRVSILNITAPLNATNDLNFAGFSETIDISIALKSEIANN